MLEWLTFLTSEVHKGFIPLLYAIAAGKYVGFIHGRDGQIRERNSFGNDPRDVKG